MSLSSTKEGQKVALTLLKKVRAILDDAQQTDKITTMQTAIKQAATGAWVTFGAIRGMGHLRWGGGAFCILAKVPSKAHAGHIVSRVH